MSADQIYDYVVVGAGAAGSIVASALATRYNVLLLEMGEIVSETNESVWNPACWYEVLADKQMEIPILSAPQRCLEKRQIPLLQSKGGGGCQLHNAMVYVRGGQSTYDYWANTLGCTRWDYASLEYYFEGIESAVGISSPATTPFTDAFFAAAQRLGLPFNPTYNSGPTEYGAVPFQFTVDDLPDGPRRTTTFEKYIAAPAPANLTIITGCIVNRVVTGEGAPSVEYLKDGQTIVVQPTAEVILSAGAIMSPAILLRSGIGPEEHLRAHGIAVVQSLPGVGQNFYDDLGIGVICKMNGTIPGQSYGYLGSGAFATATGQPPSNPPAYGEVNIEVQISTGALPGAPTAPFLPPYAIIGASALHMKSRGSVTLASTDPTQSPVVDPNWLSADGDLEHAQAALQTTLAFATDPELAAAAGWELLGPKFDHNPAVRRAEEIAYIWSMGATVQHYVGSCAMGTGPMAVVDPATLGVYGVPGLRVIDASVAPTPVTGNTAGVSMLIGAKGAALILDGN